MAAGRTCGLIASSFFAYHSNSFYCREHDPLIENGKLAVGDNEVDDRPADQSAMQGVTA